MVVNFEGSIINIRDKLDEAKKIRQGDKNLAKSVSDGVISKQKFADIIEIKRENRLAANIPSVKSESEIQGILESLRQNFTKPDKSALKAHLRIETERVMMFYPFE